MTHKPNLQDSAPQREPRLVQLFWQRSKLTPALLELIRNWFVPIRHLPRPLSFIGSLRAKKTRRKSFSLKYFKNQFINHSVEKRSERQQRNTSTSSLSRIFCALQCSVFLHSINPILDWFVNTWILMFMRT